MKEGDMSEGVTKQHTCAVCGKNYQGESIVWDVVLASGKLPLAEVAGYRCENCDAVICTDCSAGNLKVSAWSGWEKTKCPRCGQQFGPGTVQVGEMIDSRLLDSLKRDQNDFAKGKTKLIKGNLYTLLYGVIFIVLGVFLLQAEEMLFGYLMSILGVVGLIAGAASFVFKSPHVKLLEAADTFMLAVVLVAFGLTGTKMDLFEVDIPPYLLYLAAAFFVWSAYDDIREFLRINIKIQKVRKLSIRQ
jgi:hypothetical protein